MILVLASAMLSSCDDFLSEESGDLLIPETVEDLTEFFMGEAYLNISNNMWYTDVFTDDVKMGTFGRGHAKKADQYRGYYTWQTEMEKKHDGNLQYDKAWDNLYHVIMICNVTLKQIEDVKGKQNKKDFLKGEAHFLRAYAYFLLVNLYGAPYNPDTAGNDLAVPLNFEPNIQDKLFERASVEEVYVEIERDLEESVSLFEKAQIKNTMFHASKDVAYFLWSRVALYKKEWDNVIKYTSEVLKNHSSLKDLNSGVFNENSIFYSESNPEIIFSCGAPKSETTGLYAHAGNRTYFAMSDELRSLYSNNDSRKTAYIYNVSRTQYYIQNKMAWYKQPAFNPRSFRVAELFLNRAEAYVEKGEGFKNEAINDIRYLRSYRLTTEDINFDEITDVRTLVREERRRELCFESHRWFDLRRWDRPEIIHEFLIFDNRLQVISTETYVLEKNDLAYTLQIPYEVRKFNPSMKTNERPERNLQ